MDEPFIDQRLAGQRDAVGVVVGHDPPLALAVIAIAAGLEDAGRADFHQRLGQILWSIDRLERGDRAAQIGDEAFFVEPILRHFQRAGIRQERHRP